jgi:benzoyl-CoA reductase/2-hydroxyglutaryl-CoA dehydratase subunit BcrC/BadD/HgdB
MKDLPDKKKPIDPEKEKRKIKSVKTMKDIMTKYYIEAKTAAQNGKMVAWITSGGPVEPLIAMDVIPIYPENHSAMIGASHMGVGLCEVAEEMGYSMDLCSYARTDIAAATNNGGPIGGLPKPDFLVCCNNICGTVLKWYEVQSRYFNVPLFIFDTPFIHEEFSEEAKRYVTRQVDDYIDFLEKMTGRKVKEDKLEEVGDFSIQAQHMWKKVLDTCKNKPAPMTAFDAFFHLALIVTLRGSKIVVDYYKQLYNEMEQRIKDGISMVPDEKYRLLWDNLPVWFKTRWLSDKFSSRNAALVACTYTAAWSGVVDLIDKKNIRKSLGIASSSIYINISIDKMANLLKEMIRDFDIDGVVMHSNRSCKPYSLGQYDLQKMLLDDMGIPTLSIEADQVDERNFTQAQIETRIDAFMEMLEQKHK